MTDPIAVAAKVTPIAAVAPRSTDIAQAPITEPASRPSTPAAVATPTRRGVSARLRDAAVRAIPLGCYYLLRAGPAGIVGIAATLAAVVIATTALVAGRSAGNALAAQIATAQHHSNPVSSPEEGIIGKVMAALPTRDQIPAVMGVMLRQAQQAGIALDTGHYSYSPPKGGAVGRYEIEFPVRAEYPVVREFINRTLTAVPSAGLDKLRIERKVVGDVVVSADVRFVVFVRGETVP